MELVVRDASAAAEVALAQVAGARIVGRSGTSDSWGMFKRNVVGIFAKFRDEARPEMKIGALVPPTSGATPELISRDDATDRKTWEAFANYLYDTYTIPDGSKGAGRSISIQTAQDYLKCAMNLAREIHSNNGSIVIMDRRESLDDIYGSSGIALDAVFQAGDVPARETRALLKLIPHTIRSKSTSIRRCAEKSGISR